MAKKNPQKVNKKTKYQVHVEETINHLGKSVVS